MPSFKERVHEAMADEITNLYDRLYDSQQNYPSQPEKGGDYGSLIKAIKSEVKDIQDKVNSLILKNQEKEEKEKSDDGPSLWDILDILWDLWNMLKGPTTPYPIPGSPALPGPTPSFPTLPATYRRTRPDDNTYLTFITQDNISTMAPSILDQILAEIKRLSVKRGISSDIDVILDAIGTCCYTLKGLLHEVLDGISVIPHSGKTSGTIIDEIRRWPTPVGDDGYHPNGNGEIPGDEGMQIQDSQDIPSVMSVAFGTRILRGHRIMYRTTDNSSSDEYVPTKSFYDEWGEQVLADEGSSTTVNPSGDSPSGGSQPDHSTPTSDGGDPAEVILDEDFSSSDSDSGDYDTVYPESTDEDTNSLGVGVGTIGAELLDGPTNPDDDSIETGESQQGSVEPDAGQNDVAQEDSGLTEYGNGFAQNSDGDWYIMGEDGNYHPVNGSDNDSGDTLTGEDLSDPDTWDSEFGDYVTEDSSYNW